MGNALTVGDSVVGGIPTSAKEVSFNNENCHIIDTNNTQEAIKQLDVANYATNQNLARLVCQNIHLISSDATLNSNYAMNAEYILRQIESKQNNGYFSGTLDVYGNWYGFFGYNTSNNFSDDYAFIQLFKYGTSGNMCYRYSNYGGTLYKLD